MPCASAGMPTRHQAVITCSAAWAASTGRQQRHASRLIVFRQLIKTAKCHASRPATSIMSRLASSALPACLTELLQKGSSGISSCVTAMPGCVLGSTAVPGAPPANRRHAAPAQQPAPLLQRRIRLALQLALTDKSLLPLHLYFSQSAWQHPWEGLHERQMCMYQWPPAPPGALLSLGDLQSCPASLMTRT